MTNTSQPSSAVVPTLLNASAASRVLGVSKSFLDKRRVRGDGPPFRKIGSRVFYRAAELDQWVDQYRHTSTSTCTTGAK